MTEQEHIEIAKDLLVGKTIRKPTHRKSRTNQDTKHEAI